MASIASWTLACAEFESRHLKMGRVHRAQPCWQRRNAWLTLSRRLRHAFDPGVDGALEFVLAVGAGRENFVEFEKIQHTVRSHIGPNQDIGRTRAQLLLDDRAQRD